MRKAMITFAMQYKTLRQIGEKFDVDPIHWPALRNQLRNIGIKIRDGRSVNSGRKPTEF